LIIDETTQSPSTGRERAARVGVDGEHDIDVVVIVDGGDVVVLDARQTPSIDSQPRFRLLFDVHLFVFVNDRVTRFAAMSAVNEHSTSTFNVPPNSSNNTSHSNAMFTDPTSLVASTTLTGVRDEMTTSTAAAVSIALTASTISLGDVAAQPWYSRDDLFRSSTVVPLVESTAVGGHSDRYAAFVRFCCRKLLQSFGIEKTYSATPVSSDNDTTLSPDLVGNEWAHAITDEEFVSILRSVCYSSTTRAT
jgi:hypothetical protein